MPRKKAKLPSLVSLPLTKTRCERLIEFLTEHRRCVRNEIRLAAANPNPTPAERFELDELRGADSFCTEVLVELRGSLMRLESDL